MDDTKKTPTVETANELKRLMYEKSKIQHSMRSFCKVI